MQIRLIGAAEPLHEDLSKSVIEYDTLEAGQADIDFIVNITGVEPQPVSVSNVTKRNGIPTAIKTTLRNYSIETFRLYNDKAEDVAIMKQLDAWQLCSFKYFTLWEKVEKLVPVLDESGNPLYETVIEAGENGETHVVSKPIMQKVFEFVCHHNTELGRSYVTDGAAFVWVEISSIAKINNVKTNSQDKQDAHRIYNLELCEAVITTK